MTFRQARKPSLACALAAALLAPHPAFAACPIELAVYADRDQAAEIDFLPVGRLATVTNAFRMLLDNDVVLDGHVMWTEGVSRPYGILTHKCPLGDLTGAEIAACTLWEGVVYASDGTGAVGLLPEEGAAAPATLVFPDLGPTLVQTAAYGPGGFSKVPWDVFALKGCQE